MNRWDTFCEMARQARTEPVPPLDVTDRVLADLYRPTYRRADTVSWALAAGVSVLAASVAAVVTLDAWSAVTDPLAGLFQTWTMYWL